MNRDKTLGYMVLGYLGGMMLMSGSTLGFILAFVIFLLGVLKKW